jgi:hypothetical protein
MNGQVIDGQATVLEEPTALVVAPAPRTMMRPVESADAIVAAWQEFQTLKARLLDASDYQSIQGKSFPKKSAWRKLGAAFGIDCFVVGEHRREVEGDDKRPGYFVCEVTARAVAPGGRVMEATGSCASNERRFSHPDHDIRGTAETRAKNRAISDLVGGGEVSAEEVDHSDAAGAESGRRSLAETRFWHACQQRLGWDRTNDEHLRQMYAILAADAKAKRDATAAPTAPDSEHSDGEVPTSSPAPAAESGAAASLTVV